MESDHQEKAGAQESTRGGAWQIRWPGPQRDQAAGQPRERPLGRPGQQPQEDSGRTARRPAIPSRASQEVLNAIITLIRARFGDVAIGLGELGIRYRAAANR
jgi:hypothetical protein